MLVNVSDTRVHNIIVISLLLIIYMMFNIQTIKYVGEGSTTKRLHRNSTKTVATVYLPKY